MLPIGANHFESQEAAQDGEHIAARFGGDEDDDRSAGPVASERGQQRRSAIVPNG